MTAGIRGHLVAQSVLASFVEALANRPGDTDRVRRRLAAWRRRTWHLGPASSVRTLLESGAAPFLESLTFDPPRVIAEPEHMIVASVACGDGQLLLVVVPWGERFEHLWRSAVVEAVKRGGRWVLLFNGCGVRLLDASALHSRRFLEFDLDSVLDEEPAFAAMHAILRPKAFSASADSIASLVRQSERHAVGVCRSLREGVLQASGDILNALSRIVRTSLRESFEQSLTIVYRILFLLFAEARGLVPLWHPVYRESYSIEALREAAERQPPVPGLWDALRATCRLAHAGCRAGTLRVTAFNGRLFAPSGAPLAERSNFDDTAARRAVLALSTRQAPDRAGRERIAYQELGVEQLGAVYESLLDYEPVQKPSAANTAGRSAGRSPAPILLASGSDKRKATGTFYTPQPLAQYLVRQTLRPLIRDRSPEEILSLRVLDPAMGSGAFLVAVCDYLSTAYAAALIESGRCHATDISPTEQRLIRRTVAERCLFGVDLNPMATQLARLSIWLASLAADRPLSFLDHHLTSGDSLLGAWISCLRRPPGPLRRRNQNTLPLFEDGAVESAVRAALPARFSLADEPNDTAEQVRRKERTYTALRHPDSVLSRWRRIADLWCSHWFTARVSSSAFGDLSDAIRSGSCALPAKTAGPLLEDAERTASRRRFFHWELEFPEVFFDNTGERRKDAGFDVVLGNPPWDMVRADAGDASNRTRARDEEAAIVRFARESGVYEASATGHANRYQLFVERAIALTKPGGRIGLVLPSGVATDHGSSALRRLLFSRCDVETLVGFDNRLAVFPIHRSVRFVLLTAAADRTTTSIACRLGETSLAALDAIDSGETSPSDQHFPVRLAPALLERLSGPDLAIPDLRTRVDLAIAERAAALFPPAGSEEGWGLRFSRELNATDDRDCLRPAASRGVPVVEGKQLSPFAVNLAASAWKTRRHDAASRLGDRWQRPRLAYRDVASATNRVTLIAALLPAGCVSTHTVFCLRTRLPLRAQYFLCGLFNSLAVNYLARLRVTTHVTTTIVERLPIPREDQAGAFGDIVAMARQLAAHPDAEALARLNAMVARLYELSEAEFRHVLGTFPLVNESERIAAFRAFQAGIRR